MNNKEYRDKYFEAESEAIGYEMEAAGLYEAAAEAKIPAILIKGISDWGDGQKDKKWQPAAAYLAAHYVHCKVS